MSPPATRSNGVRARWGVDGSAGEERIEAAGARVPGGVGRTSGDRLGKRAVVGAPQVGASAAARARSSSTSSAARSRRRRGSTSITSARSESRSGSRSSRSASHGSHDSMPSKVWPSASRCHCSRPHGSELSSSRARALTSASGSSSRTGKISTAARSRGALVGLENVDRRSTSSPHRSIRPGWSPSTGNVDDRSRTAISPRASTWTPVGSPLDERRQELVGGRPVGGRNTTGSTT